jgi:hypothetical protein
MHLPALILAGVLSTVAHQPVPTLDTRPTCAGVSTIGIPGRTAKDCIQNEKEARDELAASWATFPDPDRKECVAETRIGGFPSYVQVLVCLQLARDARKAGLDNQL